MMGTGDKPGKLDVMGPTGAYPGATGTETRNPAQLRVLERVAGLLEARPTV